MDKKRQLQFDIIEKVGVAVTHWSSEQNVRVEHIEVIVPFVEDDFDLHVVLFFTTNADLDTYQQDGATTKIKEKYISCLKQYNYPDAWLEQVTFEFDSKENVDLNYEGSYFYRMR